MIGLDSNILLRWIIDDPSAPAQTELVRSRLERETEPLFVNHLVLAETVWVLRHAGSLPPEGLADVVSGLIDAPNIKLQQPEIVEQALASFLKNPGGFADHLIGEINRHAGCGTTLTFDRAAARSPAFTGLQ